MADWVGRMAKIMIRNVYIKEDWFSHLGSRAFTLWQTGLARIMIKNVYIKEDWFSHVGLHAFMSW